tara:strand:+ start:158 stop:331 length:174 start_codon:yes stop_codon:yes gene_type:complete
MSEVKKYKIEVGLDSEELERMLYEGKSFTWNFIPMLRPKGEEDQDIQIEVNLYNENN